MAKGKITKRAVDAALGRPKGDAFLWDDELRGFGLKVTPAGAKSFIFQFRMGGRESKTRRWTIGPYGSPWTPSSARDEAQRLARLVATGIDPVEAEKARRRQAVDLAFDSYSAKFQASCTGEGWARLVERTLRLHAVPVLKSKTLSSITRADISEVLDRIPARQQALRRNTFAVLRRLFTWAIGRGDIDRSPFTGMEVPQKVQSRDRVLDASELSAVWRASSRAGRLFSPIVRLLILTGQRRQEVTEMRWEELSRTKRIWMLPLERSKNREGHSVPLTDLAISLLDSVARSEKWPRSGLVFATSGGKAFAMHSKGKDRLDRMIAEDGEPFTTAWRLHDLRRTLATGMQQLGVRFEVTEAILNHLSGSRSGIAGIYQRHHWTDEKREALNSWDCYIQAFDGGTDEASSAATVTKART